MSVVQIAVVAAYAFSRYIEWNFDSVYPVGLVALWLLLALLNWCLIGPLTHLSPILLGAWIHDHHDTCALVFQRGLLRHRGGVVLWSPLPDGYWVTTADAAPWTVYPRGTYLQLCRGMDLAQLLERHLAGLAACAKSPLHLDVENLDSRFQAGTYTGTMPSL